MQPSGRSLVSLQDLNNSVNNNGGGLVSARPRCHEVDMQIVWSSQIEVAHFPAPFTTMAGAWSLRGPAAKRWACTLYGIVLMQAEHSPGQGIQIQS